MKYYPDLEYLIVAFLIRNKLIKEYVHNLSPKRQCIGCTRDNGDHDSECPIDYPDISDWNTGKLESKTTQKIEDQIKEILTMY